jgi:hypothetical protein
MKTITTIGIDSAKNSFSVYGVDAKGKPVMQRTFPRAWWAWKLVHLPSIGPEPLRDGLCGFLTRKNFSGISSGKTKPVSAC